MNIWQPQKQIFAMDAAREQKNNGKKMCVCVKFPLLLRCCRLSSQRRSWNPFLCTSGLLTSLGWGEPCCHRFLSACLNVENLPLFSNGSDGAKTTVQTDGFFKTSLAEANVSSTACLPLSDFIWHLAAHVRSFVINLNLFLHLFCWEKKPRFSGFTCQSRPVCNVLLSFCWWKLRVAASADAP